MLAGACGPRVSSRARMRSCAPPLPAATAPAGTAAADDVQAAVEHTGGLHDDGNGGIDDEEEEEWVAPAGGPDTRSPSYCRLFGDGPLEDAVLTMFCHAALANNLLFGDNVRDSTYTTDSQAASLAAEARVLGDMVQALLGPVHTTKLHRLMFHLLAELRNRGNLAEGDTSANEHRHSQTKQMFRRSNKRGALLMLQLIRADETRAAVLARLDGEARVADRAAMAHEMAEEEVDDDAVPDDAAQPALPCGTRLSLSVVAARPGLAGIAVCLGEADLTAALTVANTVPIRAKFEWGGRSVVQPVRGADRFYGSPWHSHVRYRTREGETAWGLVRLVVRAAGKVPRRCVVVQRLRRVPARTNCVLTRYGCIRLAWAFASPTEEWPELAAVDMDDILRVEQVHTDWRDLASRLGIFAVPSSAPQTAEERRASRLFTNVFYPWTSRSLHAGV